jgi:hypothetical protein
MLQQFSVRAKEVIMALAGPERQFAAPQRHSCYLGSSALAGSAVHRMMAANGGDTELFHMPPDRRHLL